MTYPCDLGRPSLGLAMLLIAAGAPFLASFARSGETAPSAKPAGPPAFPWPPRTAFNSQAGGPPKAPRRAMNSSALMPAQPVTLPRFALRNRRQWPTRLCVPPMSEALRAHDQLTFHLPPYTYQISRQQDGSLYSVTDGKQTISVPVSWAFGLGESGQTYILEHNGTFFESRVSYYPALDGLDLTPTTSRAPDSNLEDALGRRMLYAGETQRCFACHTTASTTNHRFDPSHLIPGVTCEACHGPGAKHVAAMKAGKVEQGLRSILDPGQLNPVDQVDFCGACHRSYVDVVLSKTFGMPIFASSPIAWKEASAGSKATTALLVSIVTIPISRGCATWPRMTTDA